MSTEHEDRLRDTAAAIRGSDVVAGSRAWHRAERAAAAAEALRASSADRDTTLAAGSPGEDA